MLLARYLVSLPSLAHLTHAGQRALACAYPGMRVRLHSLTNDDAQHHHVGNIANSRPYSAATALLFVSHCQKMQPIEQNCSHDAGLKLKFGLEPPRPGKLSECLLGQRVAPVGSASACVFNPSTRSLATLLESLVSLTPPPPGLYCVACVVRALLFRGLLSSTFSAAVSFVLRRRCISLTQTSARPKLLSLFIAPCESLSHCGITVRRNEPTVYTSKGYWRHPL